VAETRSLWWELAYNNEALKVTVETIELLDRLESVAVTRYESGRTSFQDVVKVRIRRKMLEEEAVTLRRSGGGLRVALLGLLDLPPDTPLETVEPAALAGPIPSLSELYALAAERRQELNVLRARIRRMTYMVEMTETMIQPAYTFGFSRYAPAPAVRAGAAAEGPSFSERIPAAAGAGRPRSPWYGTQDPYLRQTRLRLTALKQELAQALADTRTAVRKAWERLDRANRETALYRDEVVPLAQAALDASTRGYEGGEVAFADVIGSYELWLESGKTLARKRSEQGRERAELVRTVGSSLPGPGTTPRSATKGKD
jgi:outer membrane protein TolC